MEQTKRSDICELRHVGHSPACRRFNETGQDQRAAYKARSDKILKPRFLAGLKRSVKANPTVALSTLAKKSAVSVLTIHSGVKRLALTS